MTIFRVNVRTGRCGAAHTRYLLRQSLDTLNRGDLRYSEVGNLPAWARDVTHFFGAADRYERANGISYREAVVALDRALPPEQQVAIMREYIRVFTMGHKPYLAVLHEPLGSDGFPQPHVHVMFCERINDGIERGADQFFRRYNPQQPWLGGCRKVGSGRTPEETSDQLRELRSECAVLQNRYAAANGIEAVVHSGRGRILNSTEI